MRRRAVVLGIGAAVVLAVVGAATVAAQTGGSSSNPVGGFVGRLAANLGIGEDELQAAIDKTRGQMLDDAVAQGRLSPEAAEALKQRNFGEGLREQFQFRFKGDAERGAAPFNHDDLMAPGGPLSQALGPVADAIGIDVQTLLSELKSGKSLAQIAGDHGVSREELHRRLGEAFRARLKDWLDQPGPFQSQPSPQAPSGGAGDPGNTRT